MEFSAKWMRTIAEDRKPEYRRGSARGDREQILHDTQALESNLVDLRAESLKSLLDAVDGKEIRLASGRTVVLQTKAPTSSRSI